MPLKRKRTVAEEKKVFNFKWEIDYFMIETAEHTMMFLICSQVVKTMKGAVKDIAVFIAVKDTCMRKGLDLKNLCGICTDGAPGMAGKKQGFVARFSEYVAKQCDNKQVINQPSLYISPGSIVCQICC